MTSLSSNHDHIALEIGLALLAVALGATLYIFMSTPQMILTMLALTGISFVMERTRSGTIPLPAAMALFVIVPLAGPVPAILGFAVLLRERNSEAPHLNSWRDLVRKLR